MALVETEHPNDLLTTTSRGFFGGKGLLGSPSSWCNRVEGGVVVRQGEPIDSKPSGRDRLRDDGARADVFGVRDAITVCIGQRGAFAGAPGVIDGQNVRLIQYTFVDGDFIETSREKEELPEIRSEPAETHGLRRPVPWSGGGCGELPVDVQGIDVIVVIKCQGYMRPCANDEWARRNDFIGAATASVDDKRSCTWPLRVNTSDSPVDHPEVKKA
jgi:hypothetical protein